MKFSSAIRVFSLFQGPVNDAGYMAVYVTLISENEFERTGAVVALFKLLSLHLHLKTHGPLMKVASLHVAI